MSNAREPYGQPNYTIEENQSLVLYDCPSDRIENQLEQAGFVEENRVYKKYQSGFRTRADADDENLVVRARRIGNDELRLSAQARVGIVQVLPGSRLQIDPKIGWEPILEMILRIQDISRSRRFYGVPLDDFLGDDTSLEEIIFILTINYLNGIETIHEEGFIRDLELVYEKGFDKHGEVAVEQTVEAVTYGDPTPRWRQMKSNYDNTANSLLHFAGKRLLRIFQQEMEEKDHPAYDRLFADLHKQVNHLEDLGVTSSVQRLNEYQQFAIWQLPRQRHYYHQAIQIAETILHSTLSKEFGSSQELVVDYLLTMDKLFQDFSQAVLEESLQELRRFDKTGALDGIQIGPERSLRPFPDDNQHTHQPDHLLYRDEPTNALAVLDSKYYQEGSNPAMESESRSRMFAYAYLTDCDNLAFLCPLLKPSSQTIIPTGADLTIVAPDQRFNGETADSTPNFSIEAYEENVRSYLENVILDRYPELRIIRDLVPQDVAGDDELAPVLCLSGVGIDDLSAILDTDGPFSIQNKGEFADRVRKAAVQSPRTPTRREWELGGRWLRNIVQETCESREFPDHQTTCVPILYPAEDRSEGEVQLYFIIQEETDEDKSDEFPARTIIDDYVFDLR
jgi:hypothetical protein